MLHWNEQFETGHTEIDAQHKMLINYVNRLGSMAGNNNPNRQEIEFALRFLDFIERYTAIHFHHEENCMASFKCPIHQFNKTAHRDFLFFFHDFRQRFNTNGCQMQLVRELHERCSHWIEEHILRVDTQIRPCVNWPTEAGKRS